MKRLYYLPALCAFGAFSFFGTQEAQAAPCASSEPNQIGSSPYYNARFGVQVRAAAQTSSSNPATCDAYATPINNYSTNVMTKEASDSYNAASQTTYTYHEGTPYEYDVAVTAASNTSASISSGTVQSNLYEYGETLGASAAASSEFRDLVLIEKPSATATEINYIPVTFCSELKSEYDVVGSNQSTVAYGDYYWQGAASGDGLLWDTGSTNKVNHYANDRVCNTGKIKMYGTAVYFALGLSNWTIGNAGLDVVQDGDGNDVNIAVRDASITATFDMGAMPSGATCYSASGSFPGCERKLPSNLMGIEGVSAAEDGRNNGRTFNTVSAACSDTGTGPDAFGANAFYGNPINIALGYKAHVETDYANGALSFTRAYRSDSSWTENTIGSLWRHNFDRVLNVVDTPETTTLDLVDGTGAMSLFSYDSSVDEWSPLSEGVVTTIENTYDGSSVHDGYLFTTNADTKEYYDLDGLLYRIEYRGDEALDLAYDGSDRLSTVTNRHGKTLTFSYDGNDRVSSVVTPTGTFSYSYDSNGNLATVTKPDTESRTYHYENTSFVNALTGITDEKGVRFATYGYDTEGRAVSSKHAGDVHEHTVTYNSDGTTTTTNPLGKETIYTFETINGQRKIVQVDGQASTNCPAAGKSFAYDAQGFVESKTDWLGNVTNIDRDSRGFVTSLTEDAYGSAYRSTSITYDSTFRLPDVITEIGKTTDYDYDSDGRVTSITVTDTNTAEARTWTYSYNSNTTDGNGNTVLGRLASVNGPRTDVTDTTSYTYDSSLRLTKVTNALGHETEITSFDSANRPLTIDDVNDVETKLVYDSLGRVTSTTRAFGTASAATTSYTYDDNGNVLTITDPAGTVLTYSYDNAQRLTGIEDDLGNTITYTLDDAGNITKEDYKNVSSTLKYTHSYVYDELSRIIESVDANLDATDYAYDVNSNLTSITDANMNATSFAFDGLDRLVQATDALSGVTSYDINELDQLEGVEDPRYNETTYSYNAFGDVTQEVSPDRGTMIYTHDKAGNITSMTDARSVVTNYDYDAINRLTDIEYPSDSALDVTLTYDSASGCGYSKGRLCSVSDASGTTTYIYDILGRLTDVEETRGALSFTTEYAYDDAGVLTGITLPSGREITYTLNGNGQVSAVAADVNGFSTSLASSITYQPFGPMASMSYGNSIALTNTHNTAYQLTNRQIGSVMYENFTYDDAQFITAKGSDSYTLDDLYRITYENSDSYTYDAIGNRTSKNSDTYTYPSTNSKLSSINSTSITYDAAGNITDDGTRDYVIDAAGRLESVEISSVTVGEYVYDSANLRTQKTVSGVTTHYVYGMGGKLYGEYDASGNLIREYVYLSGAPLAQIDDVSSSDVLIYLHTDHQGTPRYATNTSGTQVWAWDSDAFGIGAPTGSATVNLRFPGQYFDDESGLHYNWNRYYNPETGRYISSDPIGLAGGLNTFGYANANPVMYTDPEGLNASICHGRCPDAPTGLGGGWGGVPGGGSILGPGAVAAGAAAGTCIDLTPQSTAPTHNNEEGEEGNEEQPSSPDITHGDIEGKTPEEIDQAAKDAGLIPKGKDPKSGKGSYIDPETGKQRVLCHPNCPSGPHGHVNNPEGQRVDADGNVVDKKDPKAHIPIQKGEAESSEEE